MAEFDGLSGRGGGVGRVRSTAVVEPFGVVPEDRHSGDRLEADVRVVGLDGAADAVAGEHRGAGAVGDDVQHDLGCAGQWLVNLS